MPAVVEAVVTARRGEPATGVVLNVSAPDIAARATAGQFIMAGEDPGLSTPAPLLKRALAIYDVSGTEDGQIALLLKVVGEGTRRLAGLQPGESIEAIGPLGNGFDLESGRGRRHLIVAGGTGIASVLLLARKLAAEPEPVTLFYGGRSAADLVGLEDFQSLGIEVVCTTEDGSAGQRGLVTEPLAERLASSEPSALYTCGPNPMMQAVAALAARYDSHCQLSVESKMACGFGVCLGCTVRTRSSLRLACVHGPVFDAAEFLWEPEPGREPVVS